MNDLKFAFRQLLKNPGFTAVAVLTLTLGIGANTAIFTIVDTVVLKPLPYDQPEQLVRVWEAPRPGERMSVSPGAFLDWKEHNTVFESLSLLQNTSLNLVSEGEPERINGLTMSANGLQIFRARPLLGRLFAPDEDQPGKDKVVVLTHGFWQRRFGGEPNIPGRPIQLNDESYTVIGVLPPRFLPWGSAEFVIPRAIAPGDVKQRTANFLQVIGRLKPGVSVEQAQSEMNALAARLKPLYPPVKKDWGVTVISMHEQITGGIKPALLVLASAVGFVLLIACANVANLLLAKASGRQKEMAVRAALGASRWRVIRQLLVESVLLSMLGALLGLLVALWSIGAVRQQLPAVNLPRTQEIGLDLRVLSFALLVSLAAGVVFGLAPALAASRPDLSDMLKEGARGSGAGSRNRFQSGLIVGEVALSLILLIGAGLLLNSFVRLLNVPPGFDPHHVLTMQVTLPANKYPNPERQEVLFGQILERIRNLPGIESAGVGLDLPMSGASDTMFKVAGRSGQPNFGHVTDFNFCSPDYFRAAGIPVIKGRSFDPRDRADAPRVVIINEALAREHFPNQDPIGQRIHMDTYTGRNDDGWEIVGVVGNVRQRGLAENVRPCVYRPLAFNRFGGNLIIRTSGPPLAMAASVRKMVQAVDPNQPVANVRTMEEVIAALVAQRRFILMLLAGFAGVALLLAAIGLYGVIAYSVAQRTREIGIRMALGASRRAVQALVLRQGTRLAGIGVFLGLAGALALTRLLTRLLFEVKPTDPATFACVSLLLLLVALLASWLPARRAARVDPMEALRCE